jgi:hypothetical protein
MLRLFFANMADATAIYLQQHLSKGQFKRGRHSKKTKQVAFDPEYPSFIGNRRP